MNNWNNLSMRERAAFIRTGVANGYTDINSIKGQYNLFAMGGPEDTEPYRSAGEYMRENNITPITSNEKLRAISDYQKQFAEYWYKERAKQSKYRSQLEGDKLQGVLNRINQSTFVEPKQLMSEILKFQGKDYSEKAASDALRYLGKVRGFADPSNPSRWTTVKGIGNTWHEGIGHAVGDKSPAILRAAPLIELSGGNLSDEAHTREINKPNEKNAQTWDFRGNNLQIKDAKGKYIIDPNRQLNAEDIKYLREHNGKIPSQWEGLSDEEIADFSNSFAFSTPSRQDNNINYAALGGRLIKNIYRR